MIFYRFLLFIIYSNIRICIKIRCFYKNFTRSSRWRVVVKYRERIFFFAEVTRTYTTASWFRYYNSYFVAFVLVSFFYGTFPLDWDLFACSPRSFLLNDVIRLKRRIAQSNRSHVIKIKMELLIDQDQPLLTRIIYDLLKIQIPHFSLIVFINFFLLFYSWTFLRFYVATK